MILQRLLSFLIYKHLRNNFRSTFRTKDRTRKYGFCYRKLLIILRDESNRLPQRGLAQALLGRGPNWRTCFTMGFDKFDSIRHAQDFVNISSKRQIIYLHRLNDIFLSIIKSARKAIPSGSSRTSYERVNDLVIG